MKIKTTGPSRPWPEILRERYPQPNQKFLEHCEECARKDIRECEARLTDTEWQTKAGDYFKKANLETARRSVEAETARRYCYIYYRAHSGFDPVAAREWNEITGESLPTRR